MRMQDSWVAPDVDASRRSWFEFPPASCIILTRAQGIAINLQIVGIRRMPVWTFARCADFSILDLSFALSHVASTC